MKKIVMGMMAVIIAFSATAQVNTENKQTGKAANRMDRRGGGQGKMLQDLNLSQEQKTKMKSLNEDFSVQIKTLKGNTSLTAQQKKDQREALMKQHRTNLQTILTPEQLRKMDEKKKNRGKGFDKEGQRAGKPTAELNLNNDQSKKMKTFTADFKSKAEAIKKDASLSSLQKKEQISSLRKQHADEVKSILTEEQKSKLEELRKNHPDHQSAK